MKRREFLAAVGASGLLAYTQGEQVLDFGARPVPPRLSLFRNSFGRYPIKDIGQGRQSFLWKFFEAVTGKPLEPHYQGRQGNERGEGDCVGHAFGLAVDILAATEIFLKREPEEWLAKASVEMIYAGSRVEIGKGVFSGTGGSRPDWAAAWLKEYGVLHRVEYPELDLRGYSPARSRQYRDTGVPDDLEPIAREHPVRDWSFVTDAATARDLLYAGQPIVLASSYAVKPTRDKDGFGQLYKSVWRRRWPGWVDLRLRWRHAMLLAGMDDKSERKGALCINSHGANWIKGPKRHGQPEGSFWLEWEDVELMLRDMMSSIAISSYRGHPKIPLHSRLY